MLYVDNVSQFLIKNIIEYFMQEAMDTVHIQIVANLMSP
jgi:hypothetical protein